MGYCAETPAALKRWATQAEALGEASVWLVDFRPLPAAWLQPGALRLMRRFHNRADATLVPTMELEQALRTQGFSRVVRLARAVATTQFTPNVV